MHARLFTRVALALLTVTAGLFAAACSTTTERPQSFTGQVEQKRTPHYEAHGKGQQWGRYVYR